MKSLLVLLALTSFAAHSMDTFTSSNGKTLKVYTEAEYAAIDSGKTPACLKRGGAVLEKNKAYTKLFGNNKKPCGESAVAKRYAGEATVLVVKVNELPDSLFKKFAR
jgi:hypothetical protein